MSIQQVNQEVVRNTRARTAEAWKLVGKNPNIPTPLLDLLSVIVQRQEDIEEALGYVPEVREVNMQKVDTQGR